MKGYKADATGRSTGRRATNRKQSIPGQFSWRLVEMLESPAWRATTLAARKVLDRIEIEHAHHAGKENGQLPVTFTDFAAYGLDKHSIAPALRELEALGFLETTQRGTAGNSAFRRPSLYRLTYQHTRDAPPTDEWRRIDSREQATATLRAARDGEMAIERGADAA